MRLAGDEVVSSNIDEMGATLTPSLWVAKAREGIRTAVANSPSPSPSPTPSPSPWPYCLHETKRRAAFEFKSATFSPRAGWRFRPLRA